MFIPNPTPRKRYLSAICGCSPATLEFLEYSPRVIHVTDSYLIFEKFEGMPASDIRKLAINFQLDFNEFDWQSQKTPSEINLVGMEQNRHLNIDLKLSAWRCEHR